MTLPLDDYMTFNDVTWKMMTMTMTRDVNTVTADDDLCCVFCVQQQNHCLPDCATLNTRREYKQIDSFCTSRAIL